MKRKKIESTTLGAFEVTSDKLVISDPCYDLGTWCMGTIPNVKPGLWSASIGVVDTGEFGKRVAYLSAFHQGSPDIRDLKVCPATFEVGVDSGQAGIFDFSHFQDESVIADQKSTDFGSRWYTFCCHQTLDTEHHAGLVPYGVVASSGFGDGGYSCNYYTEVGKADNPVCGVVIDFALVRMERVMRHLVARQAKEGLRH